MEERVGGAFGVGYLQELDYPSEVLVHCGPLECCWPAMFEREKIASRARIITKKLLYSRLLKIVNLERLCDLLVTSLTLRN